jgi:hypothetical protein
MVIIGVVLLYGIWKLYLVDREQNGDISLLKAISYGIYAFMGAATYSIGLLLWDISFVWLVPLGMGIMTAAFYCFELEKRAGTLTLFRKRDYLLYGEFGVLVIIVGLILAEF